MVVLPQCVEAEGGEGFMPNFRYRYFSEDIPVGLMVTRGVAELAGVPTVSIGLKVKS